MGLSKRVISRLKASCVLASLALVPQVWAADAVPPAPAGSDWRYYGSDAASTKYSPLSQINKDNVKNLKIAWRWKSENFGPRPEFNMEETPLMVDGVLYFLAGTRRNAVAVDAATGETLWTYRLDEGRRGQLAPRLNHRGVAFWTDGQGAKRILYITPAYQLVALDAATGRPVDGFGEKGIVDLYKDFDQPEPENGRIGSSSPPIVVGDVVVVGAALESIPRSKENVKSYVRGYNVRTGKREWIFHTIPQKGEFGYDTWKDGSAEYTGNAGVWTTMSADPELGYVYLPIETPTNDYSGITRPGDNLFSESLVCLDAKTGKRVWHFQMVHHGIWDYDAPYPPILLDIKQNGKIVKAAALVTKQAFVYTFDRVTGKPIWPIRERKVPKSKIPGEITSPTQPYPSLPAPFDEQNFSVENLIDFTPELRKQALEMIKDYDLGGIFTPPTLPGDGKKGLLKLPSSTGGANWQGGAADPETGILYVASGTNVGGPIPVVHPGEKVQYEKTDAITPPGDTEPRFWGPQGLPLVRPPYGRITAIDMNTGQHKWMIANSDTPDWIKNHPALKGVNIPRTGSYEHSGIMVTKTLLFTGEGAGLYAAPSFNGGNKLRAHDKATGEIIHTFELPANQTGIPMTYAVNGKQFIVVAVGARGKPGELVALTAE